MHSEESPLSSGGSSRGNGLPCRCEVAVQSRQTFQQYGPHDPCFYSPSQCGLPWLSSTHVTSISQLPLSFEADPYVQQSPLCAAHISLTPWQQCRCAHLFFGGE